MSPTPRHLTAAAIALVALLAAGCVKKPPAPAPAPPAPAPSTTPTPTPTPPPAPAPAPAPPAAALSDLRTVYFALDSSQLDDAARGALDADAKLLRDNATWAPRLEGNCDERGTVEYNLALGQRRADAVKDYLVGAGVNASRLSTISYGKERPAADGHDEAAWSKNRRVDFGKP